MTEDSLDPVALEIMPFVAAERTVGNAKVCGVAKGAAEIEICLGWIIPKYETAFHFVA